MSLRKALRARDGDNCHWCEEPMLFGTIGITEEMATIEHLTPRWRGGSNELANLVLAHGRCNHRRNEADQKPQRIIGKWPTPTTAPGGSPASGE